MRVESLDHVALWVADRDRLSHFLCRALEVHEIARTDAFTLVGADARRGKLTLFDAEGEREPGPLARIGLRVRDLGAALRRLPTELELGPAASFTAPGGLGLALVEDPATRAEVDLDHVLLRVPDPPASFAALAGLGFSVTGDRLRAGGAWIDLEAGDPRATERPLLHHLGLLVESATDHLEEAERRGLDVADVVDAENTIAVFVWGPDGVKLEYVEHKPTFSLV